MPNDSTMTHGLLRCAINYLMTEVIGTQECCIDESSDSTTCLLCRRQERSLPVPLLCNLCTANSKYS